MARRRRGHDRAARRYDVTAKHLLEADPVAWLSYVGLAPTGPVAVVDADLSTVLAEADKVVRVAGTSPWLVHLEVQSTYDATMPARMLQYNSLLHRRHGLPIASVLILLRPEADGPALDGTLELAWSGSPYLTFGYRIVRAWEQPVEDVLAGGLATLPLAPLADAPQDALPSIIRRIEERLASEAGPGDAASLWAATYLLVGLRYSAEVAQVIESLARALRESTTYQAILREGEARGEARGLAEGARRALLRAGSRRLGPPDPDTVAALTAITEVERLERMTERVLDAASWADVIRDP